jgi:diacylglycerol kinase
VRDAKDVAAGAVLITAIASIVIAVIIFWPHVMGMFA